MVATNPEAHAQMTQIPVQVHNITHLGVSASGSCNRTQLAT